MNLKHVGYFMYTLYNCYIIKIIDTVYLLIMKHR